MEEQFILSRSQIETLSALMDTFLPRFSSAQEEELQKSVIHSEEFTATQVKTLANFSANSLQVPTTAVRMIKTAVPKEKQAILLRVLSLLSTRPGSLLLTGHFTPFAELSFDQREKTMLNWKTSQLQGLRTLYASFSVLTLFNAYKITNSPLGKAIGYDTSNGDVFFKTHPDYRPIEHPRIPMMTTAEATQHQLEYDVVVVGSGAGGGVVAAQMALAGYSVLVIEMGKYYHQSEMIFNEENGYEVMYDGGGSPFTSENGAMHSLSGSTLGGGTALNYLVSLKPQHYVREEWAKKLGLGHFISPQFEKDLNHVFDRIGASTEGHLDSKASQKFEKGCKNLGYHIERVPVNTGGNPHYCSRCMYGCQAGIKHSTANTWLLDAMRNGAHFLDETKVTKITTQNNKASGVVCYVHGSEHPITIKAKRVVASCGAMRTPHLLRISGLKNPNIGKNLKLHPIVFNFGLFDEPVNQTEGPLMTRVCNVSENFQGDYYGVKIEEGHLLPGVLSIRLPWLSAVEHRELMLKHKNIATLLNVVRDKDSIGVIDFNPNTSDDRPVYNYYLSKHDELSVVEGIVKTMHVLAASGARKLYTTQANIKPFAFKENEESDVANPRFIRWIERVRNAGILSVSSPLTSVHQMATCRMGNSPRTSVVQPTGATWETQNLYVADGSVIPTATAVNPMVTIEAIALHVSRNIIASFKQEARL